VKLEAQCPTCVQSTRKGLLWLGGDDWLECPDCAESGKVEIIAERFAPKERTVSLVGIGTFTERRHHPSIAHLQDEVECRSIA
jgi:hypothetical protein